MDYQNPDIILDRSHLNVHFKTCESTYEQEFNRLVESGAVSLRGLKPDAKVFDELVFDVNTAYFDERGGYEFAKQFYAEAYKLAVQEAGGEEYVLSAVLHADERNRALSDEQGRDVFHYHLHVVYLPVVDKEIYFKKNNKNPELAGKLREVVKQVSHSKKWPRFKGDDGKWENSYTLLQDRYFQHMRDAGFEDFERGERKSTAKHLSVMEYKNQKEAQRAAALESDIAAKSDKSASLDKTVQQKQARLSELDSKISVGRKAAATVESIDRMAHKRTIMGDIPVSQDNWKTVTELAKEGLKSRETITQLREANTAKTREIAAQKAKLKGYGEGVGITDNMQFYRAKQRAPKRMAEVIAHIMQQPPEQPPLSRNITRDKRHDQSR